MFQVDFVNMGWKMLGKMYEINLLKENEKIKFSLILCIVFIQSICHAFIIKVKNKKIKPSHFKSYTTYCKIGFVFNIM